MFDVVLKEETSGWLPSRKLAALKRDNIHNADGGDCTVVNLPDEGITGNSHFMFQELNNDVIADHIAAWLESKGLN